MNYSRMESDLPELELLPQNELSTIIKQLLAQKNSTFGLRSLVSEFAGHISRTRKGFKSSPNTEYGAKLNERDVTRIREVIWDFIIARYLTPGSFMNDNWPELTISERGEKYFAKYKP